ncbi:CsgG/HfaB family protein [Flammeovirgaceae bacterium SG7u.111]|nr:CsgG/HfaB family protein [Flammeovirgaceae bacterium SG7u.132]WPO35588.1 CsgG/HfaB family protein [Flammeovirgaceae bacterium SG7u.111]
MKRAALIVFSILFMFNVQAQEVKETVGIFPFTSSQYNYWSRYRNYANGLSEVVVDAMVNSQRFTVVDRTNFDDVLKEGDLQKGEDFIEGLVVAQGKKLGAQYAITGTIISASADKASTSKIPVSLPGVSRNVSSYFGSINFTIKIIDVETGQIKASETLKSVSAANFVVNTPEDAISNAVTNSDDEILKFINKHFKIRAVVQKVRLEKKGEAKEIVIEGGTAKGFKKGQMFEIKEISIVQLSNGKEVEQVETVGEVKIISVDNEYFSTCKVYKGGDMIKSKIDKGVVLYAMPEVD